jgi:predicted NBD/HSP70 family sugar kinase
MPIDVDGNSGLAGLRERSLRLVFDELRRVPRRSRAELAEQVGLSKPTVGSALRALADGGLVRERGRTTGRRGPSALLYEPVSEAALVLGVDIGAHHIRAVVADLEGTTLGEARATLERPNADHVLEALRGLRTRMPFPTFELAVVGSPGVVDPETARIRSSPNIVGWEGVHAEALLQDALGVKTIVENDVNLAALGELARGAGKGRGSFAYLNVGSGLGAGLVLGGRLHRGRHGAAGEVGYLAVDITSPQDPASSRGPMEQLLSHKAVVRAARTVNEDAPADPRELFEMARRGDPIGQSVVAETVSALAACIASITAVVDLELVLLGGGIGAQGDLLLEPVRAAIATRVPYVPDIECGALGDRAALIGAIALGAEFARAAVLRRCLTNGNSR